MKNFRNSLELEPVQFFVGAKTLKLRKNFGKNLNRWLENQNHRRCIEPIAASKDSLGAHSNFRIGSQIRAVNIKLNVGQEKVIYGFNSQVLAPNE